MSGKKKNRMYGIWNVHRPQSVSTAQFFFLLLSALLYMFLHSNSNCRLHLTRAHTHSQRNSNKTIFGAVTKRRHIHRKMSITMKQNEILQINRGKRNFEPYNYARWRKKTQFFVLWLGSVLFHSNTQQCFWQAFAQTLKLENKNKMVIFSPSFSFAIMIIRYSGCAKGKWHSHISRGMFIAVYFLKLPLSQQCKQQI